MATSRRAEIKRSTGNAHGQDRIRANQRRPVRHVSTGPRRTLSDRIEVDYYGPGNPAQAARDDRPRRRAQLTV